MKQEGSDQTNKWIYEHSETIWGENQEKPLNRWEQDVLDRYVRRHDGRILEGCSGGGRISHHLWTAGFKNIDAFDFVESFIEQAKRHNPAIRFFVADARNLSMIPDNSYDYVIYLQQCLCFIPVEGIETALRENYRVCKHGGMAVFSFLNFRGRGINKVISPFLMFLRKCRHEELSPQQLPWLRLQGKKNWDFWRKGQATNYWFTKEEITERLEDVGYSIVEMFTTSESHECEGSGIYVVCTKT